MLNMLKVYSCHWIHLIVHTSVLFRRILLAVFLDFFTTLLLYSSNVK